MKFSPLVWPCYFRYVTLRYRFDEEGVAVSWGFFFRKETYLTYTRIQDIHVSRGIVERWLGLGTVEIQTASGSSQAEEAIVGVTEFDAIRNFLYARMRVHELHNKQPQAAGSASENAEQVLREIRTSCEAFARWYRSGAMYEQLRSLLLPLLQVPSGPPEPPPGHAAGEFLETFRASPAYLKYRLFFWSLYAIAWSVGL